MQGPNADNPLAQKELQREASDTHSQDDPITIDSPLCQLTAWMARNDRVHPPLLERFSALTEKSFQQILNAPYDGKTARILIARLQHAEEIR